MTVTPITDAPGVRALVAKAMTLYALDGHTEWPRAPAELQARYMSLAADQLRKDPPPAA